MGDILASLGLDLVLAAAIVLFVFTAAIGLPLLLGNLRWRRYTATSTAHQVLGDTYASWTVDHSLKAMILACEREGIAVPDLVMVVADTSAVHLYVASPALVAPEPWVASPDGIIWSTSLIELQDAPVRASTINTFTGLVTLGVSAAGRVFVDLSQAKGLIAITGDKGYRRALAQRWIDDFSTSPWSAGTTIDLLELDDLATTRTSTAASSHQIIAKAAAGAVGVAFVAQAPKKADSDALLRALGAPGCRLPVIALGRARHARWKFTAHADGWVTSDFLPTARAGVVSLAPGPVDAAGSGTAFDVTASPAPALQAIAPSKAAA